MRRTLPLAVVVLALLLAGAAGAKPSPTPAQRLGFPPLKPGPVPGYLMIADRNNNRIIIVSPATRKIVWQFPRPGDIRPGQSFHDPDDAFFTPDYMSISTNEEYNQQIGEIDIQTHRLVWTFGHAGVRGSAFGYLSNPDDAYLLPNGLFMVADIQNCRVLFISRAHKVVREIGHAGQLRPQPAAGALVAERRDAAAGRRRARDGDRRLGRPDLAERPPLYTVRTPTTLSVGRAAASEREHPRRRLQHAGPRRRDHAAREGSSGRSRRPATWSLDRPSLAVRWPNGMIAITDDWHHRVLVVDPKTKQVVWSYGHLNQPGSAPGYLNKPDGLDLLPAIPGGIRATQASGAPAAHAER